MSMAIASCKALTCSGIVVICLGSSFANRGVLVPANQRTPERRLAGIELEKTFPHELIPQWGTPAQIKDLNQGSVGELTYSWERGGMRLTVDVVYWTRDGRRCEDPIVKIRLSGTRSTPDGFWKTGCGLALGDGIGKARACYGIADLDYRISGPTTADALPAGTHILVYEWETKTRLELAFDALERIIQMELSVIHI